MVITISIIFNKSNVDTVYFLRSKNFFFNQMRFILDH